MLCRTCKNDKSLTEFNIIKSTYNSLSGEPIKYEHYRKDCKPCHAKKKYEKLMRNKYNISVSHFEKLVELQNNLCAICENVFKGREPFIDHCHHTGKVRGLLCTKCNFGIGHFNDSIELMEKAIRYLKAWLQIVPEGCSCN